MKFNMKSFKRSASLFGLKVRKNAPTIAVVAGSAASVAAVVVACKRTMQLNDVVEEHK